MLVHAPNIIYSRAFAIFGRICEQELFLLSLLYAWDRSYILQWQVNFLGLCILYSL